MTYSTDRPLHAVRSKPASLLIVDDDDAICEVLSTYLRPHGYLLRTARDGASALAALASESFDVAIIDLRLPDIGGLDIQRAIRDRGLETEVIIITGHASLDSALEAIKAGAFDYIIKPFNLKEIEVSVRNAVDRLNLVIQNRALSDQVRVLTARLERVGEPVPPPKILFEDFPSPPVSSPSEPSVVGLAAYSEVAERKARPKQ